MLAEQAQTLMQEKRAQHLLGKRDKPASTHLFEFDTEAIQREMQQTKLEVEKKKLEASQNLP